MHCEIKTKTGKFCYLIIETVISLGY